jgi:glycopeptide antibiotics resistance protein
MKVNAFEMFALIVCSCGIGIIMSIYNLVSSASYICDPLLILSH